ncbi:MAG TPA: glutamine amidotransferase family protein [Spirochaetota bacterium]|nr:glutamine amidotransferase family protein [Spirochaetota bacterium]
MNNYFRVIKAEEIPTKQIPEIKSSPLHYRYFIEIVDNKKTGSLSLLTEEDYVVNRVVYINKNIEGAFVVSSGKNFGAFKGVGFPEDISKFFMLENYKAYAWTAHNRFPTNTPGWWGGAHPFTLLDFSIVHNGELSSYGINKRYVEMFGYECTMLTDTEVVAYLVDLLVRKHGLPFKTVCDIFSPPTWDVIQNMEDIKLKEYYKTLRIVYGSALLNGPFAFIIGFNGGLIGLSDRIKLRPLVVVESGNTVYLSSEESSVLEVCDKIDRVYHPEAGEPVFIFYNDYKGE